MSTQKQLPPPRFEVLPPEVKVISYGDGAGAGVDIESVVGLVTNAVRSVHSKRQYTRFLTTFLGWARITGQPFTKATVNAFRQHLQDKGASNSTINGHLSAIRKLAVEAADAGVFSPDIAAAITRAPGMPRQSRKTGRWLVKAEAERLLLTPSPTTAVGIRDRAILGLLIGCGLRRAEVAGLGWAQFQIREGRHVLLDVLGKGSKTRTTPVPTWAANLVIQWRDRTVANWAAFSDVAAADDLPNQFMFPAMRKGTGGVLDTSSKLGLSPQSIRLIVIRHATEAGLTGDALEEIGAHDLRRTFAKLARKNGADLEQIQFTLGHASLTTTELYLGGKQNLQDAPCDVLGIDISSDKAAS